MEFIFTGQLFLGVLVAILGYNIAKNGHLLLDTIVEDCR